MPSPPNYVDVVREVPVMNYVEVVHYEDEVVWEVQETERHVPEVTEVHKFVDTFVDETQEREEVVVKPSEEYVKHPLTGNVYSLANFITSFPEFEVLYEKSSSDEEDVERN
eukprot:GHVH01009427.1.p1 GENE.GHVH01009427.1~~GHVH01009427.1.p1  ORF type:complete len:111 (+),score=26.81 GHVH01009427.1:857-1189(+)